MGLDGETIDQMTDMDQAFNLLLQPLGQHLLPDQQAFILIDALDEGDPPDQQQVDKGTLFQPVGNKAFRLVITCLVEKLPKNIRFVFTTRRVAPFREGGRTTTLTTLCRLLSILYI